MIQNEFARIGNLLGVEKLKFCHEIKKAAIVCIEFLKLGCLLSVYPLKSQLEWLKTIR